MSRRARRSVLLLLLALAAAAALAATRLPYLPWLHGTTEEEAERLAEIRRAAGEAGLGNLEAIRGDVASTGLPEGCCDALMSRMVYHHLTDPSALHADILRALRPGGRYLVIDFEPGGLLDWIARTETAGRHGGHGTPTETVVREVTAAGFELVRGPEPWRGRTYAVLFRRPAP